MKALVFAAGLGTRLKPITDTMPKALVPVCGKPLIEHILRKLMASGVDEAVVNVHHFADMIEDWLGKQDWLNGEGMTVKVSDEREKLLETGGAVLFARRYLEGCGSFIVHNVDVFTDCDLKWFASEVREDAVATLLVSPRQTSRYFLFHPDTMRLVGWTDNRTGEYILTDNGINVGDCLRLAFSGVHIMSDKVFLLMDEYVREKNLETAENVGVRFSIRDFYLWAAARVPVYGVCAQNLRFLDVGKLDAIEAAESFIAGSPLKNTNAAAVNTMQHSIMQM